MERYKTPRTVVGLVREYERRHANEYNLKPSTLAEYTRQLDALVAQLGDVPLTQLDEGDIAAYLGACSHGSLPSRFSVCAALLRWGDRKVHKGLAELVPERRPARRWSTRWLDAAEFVAVWSWMDERERRPRARPVTLDAIRLAMICPLRRSEIASLSSDEVDLDGAALYLFDTKSDNRVVPMSPMAVTICRRRMLGCGGGYLFPARGRPGHICAESLSHAWCRIVRACGLRRVRLHDCRHTWASHAIAEGVSLEHVRRTLGHSTEWMAVRYSHVASADLRRSAARVESALLGGGHGDA